MKFSLAFKLFVFILIPLTLGWKLSVRPAISGEAANRAAHRKMADFLAKQHFSVSVSERPTEGQPSIVATAGACRVLAAKSPAMGWDRDLVRQHAAPADQVFVVYRGRVYPEQPTWRTVPDFLWARILRELGISSESPPVFAIISPSSCQADRLPWHELAQN